MIKRIKEILVYENERIQLFNDDVEWSDRRKGTYLRLTYHGNPKGAVIIPRHPDGRLLLLKIYRYAVSEVSLEFPRGGGHSGENVKDAASRELKDETNLIPINRRLLGYLRPDSAILMTEVGVVLAELEDDAEKVLRPCSREGIEEARFYARKEISKLTSTGGIRDGFTLGALALLQAYESAGD